METNNHQSLSNTRSSETHVPNHPLQNELLQDVELQKSIYYNHTQEVIKAREEAEQARTEVAQFRARVQQAEAKAQQAEARAQQANAIAQQALAKIHKGQRLLEDVRNHLGKKAQEGTSNTPPINLQTPAPTNYSESASFHGNVAEPQNNINPLGRTIGASPTMNSLRSHPYAREIQRGWKNATNLPNVTAHNVLEPYSPLPHNIHHQSTNNAAGGQPAVNSMAAAQDNNQSNLWGNQGHGY